jgi:ADP-heptose:LPS heptosyltransferase
MLFWVPYFWLCRFDVVLDLQNNKISRVLRYLLFPSAWTEFDKSSPLSAGERTRLTIEATGIFKSSISTQIGFKSIRHNDLLRKYELKVAKDLVVLNPAGYCEARNWPLDYYVEFARLWLEKVNPHTQFVLLLLPAKKSSADHIESALGEACLNLTGAANQLEAFTILKNCKFVLSEDSGLMHMSWIQGIPTIGLFSSSRKDWSAPQGSWSYCFDSSDLECGPCMLEQCKFGDNRCLTRYTPEIVLRKAKELLTIKEK